MRSNRVIEQNTLSDNALFRGEWMFFGKTKYYLMADIGGTKSVLAIIDDKYHIKFKKIYPSQEIRNLAETINQFLREPECRQYTVKVASLAIAGPINNERTFAQPTHTEWSVDANNIIQHTPLRKVLLINDFEATGFSIDQLKPEQYTELTDFGRNTKGTIAIIGAGTGLGVGILSYDGKRHTPIASEGGHVSLPIRADDAIDIKLESFLKKKGLYKDAEDVISGRGIANIYNFLSTQNIRYNKKSHGIISKASIDEKPALITKYALEDKDILCIRTLEIFIKYYARTASNLALTTLCSELVIAGGIAPKILPVLQDMFIEVFTQPERAHIRKFLEHVTIIVITDTDVNLYGSLNALNYEY